MRRFWLGILVVLGGGGLIIGQEKQAGTPQPVLAAGQVVNKPLGRFAAEIAAFAEMDRKNSWPAGAVLFVGSSSIRMWATREAFPDLPVINRGFGGASIPDVLERFDKVVAPYGAQVIVFYCGDNDIVSGRTAEQVCGDFQEFVRRVRALDNSQTQNFTTKTPRHQEEIKNQRSKIKSLTEENEGNEEKREEKNLLREEEKEKKTKIIFMAIKPSESRWGVWAKMARANELIGEWIKGQEGMEYFDAASILLKDGQPDPVFFEKDQLHLNQSGYKVWNAKIGALLTKKD